MKPQIIDAFPFNNELDMLECRLTEIYDAVDKFVLVEAPVDHQDHPKPLWYAEHKERFTPWADKIVHVVADKLPTLAEDPDPWAREHAQREYIAEGLGRIGVFDDDIVLQSDVDEIPRALHVRNCRPNGMLAFGQRLHCFAVDWLHPDEWRGTVAGRALVIHQIGPRPFGRMRDSRNTIIRPLAYQDAGWHLSWLGGTEATIAKVNSFCHPEILRDEPRRVMPRLQEGQYLRDGFHVDDRKMAPVDVDESWPKWVFERKCPANWFRPR
jgi:hypothetical protein